MAPRKGAGLAHTGLPPRVSKVRACRIGNADSPTQFRTPKPVGRLWNCACLGRDGNGQHVGPHGVVGRGGDLPPCTSRRHLQKYVLL